MNGQITSIICGITSASVVGLTLTIALLYARAHKLRRLRHVVIVATGVAWLDAMISFRMNQNYARLSQGLGLTITPEWVLWNISAANVLIVVGVVVLMFEIFLNRK